MRITSSKGAPSSSCSERSGLGVSVMCEASSDAKFDVTVDMVRAGGEALRDWLGEGRSADWLTLRSSDTGITYILRAVLGDQVRIASDPEILKSEH